MRHLYFYVIRRKEKQMNEQKIAEIFKKYKSAVNKKIASDQKYIRYIKIKKAL